ncbi:MULTISPECIES: hypothetical protein [Streptomyces]|jgi:hypothetical protein|uniref:Copper resistance protein D domain-containing protein n=1 Tax=Streptomyces nymphaeiformis TaxID=2663842 RepID=A0A7W7TXQ3_9ACTN|nr:hypothetical protein [Streptomyces nymphaeiformis]MBB4981307.1 hypothetical protein [Streptomyces nymphaeiformis]
MSRTAQELTPSWLLTALGLVATAGIAAACWTAGHVHADASLLTVARFFHVAFLVVGLGSVLAVDWLAVLWLTGKRPLTAVLDTAVALQTPIWTGLGGLVVSGLFLRPDLHSPLTLVKLGLVVAVTLNGLWAHRLGQLLEAHRSDSVPRGLLVRSGLAATISQTGWWGACLIGFLNSQG